MLKNMNMRKKLFLFPILFILIVIGSGLVYKHFSNIAHQRNNAAISTEEFIQQIIICHQVSLKKKCYKEK